MRIAIALALSLTACSAAVTPSPAPASPRPTTTAGIPRGLPAPSATPDPRGPVVLASDARAGVILLAGYAYRGSVGELTKIGVGNISSDGRAVDVFEGNTLLRQTGAGTSRIDGPPGIPYIQGGDLSRDGAAAAFVGDRRLYVSLRGDAFREVVPGLSVAQVAWSPDGRHLAITECVACGAIVGQTRIDLYDAETGRFVVFYQPPRARSYGDAVMRLYVEGLKYLSWSPDGRFFAGLVDSWYGRPDEVDVALRGARELLVFDTATARTWSLGQVVVSGDRFGAPSAWFTWGGAHSLAFVAGEDIGTWANKSLRVWTPETGTREVMRGATYSPTWDAAGTTLFVVFSPASGSSPSGLPSGIAPDDARIVRIDASTGATATVLQLPRLHAVRASDDGRTLLYAVGTITGTAIGVTSANGDAPRAVLSYPNPLAFKPALTWLGWDP